MCGIWKKKTFVCGSDMPFIDSEMLITYTVEGKPGGIVPYNCSNQISHKISKSTLKCELKLSEFENFPLV